jgi:hypothetical protein
MNKRPLSIWITQILMLIYMALLIFAAAIPWISQGLDVPGGSKALMSGAFLVLLIVFALVFWGLAYRRNWARLAAIIIFLIMAINSITRLFTDQMLIAPGNSAQKTGFIIGALAVAIPLLLLIYFLLTSPKVKNFFTDAEANAPTPPPIESYDEQLNLKDSAE